MPGMKVEKPPSAYHAHRERQHRRILDAASTLFDERGIDRVTMAEITAASGVQPSTMYRYFSNKDDVVWAILGDLMQEKSSHAKKTLQNAPNALARITALLELMADDLSHKRATVRFMAQFDAIYARNWPVDRLLSLESQIHPQPFQWFAELIRGGIADGSLRSDLDPDMTLHAVINAVIGAQRRLASLGNKIELEYGLPIDRLFRETIRVLLLGLRAVPKTPLRRKPKTKARKPGARKRNS